MRVMTIRTDRALTEGLAQRGDLTVLPVVPSEYVSAWRGRGWSAAELEVRHKLDRAAVAKLNQLYRTLRPDVVQCWSGTVLAVALQAARALPPAIRPRIASFFGVAEAPSRWDPGYRMSLLHPDVDAHCCISEASRQALIASGVDPGKCHVTHGFYQRGQAGSRPLPFTLPDDSLVICTVASIRPVKRIDMLLQAAIDLRHHSQLQWLLIGPIRDKRVSRLLSDPRLPTDRVHCLGYQAQAASLVAEADLFVMPSRSEGLCYALLEAMSQGVCPIVTAAGGMVEVVRHRRDGWVVPVGNQASLNEAIEQLSQDEKQRKALSASAQQRVLQQFNRVAVVERFVQAYRQIQPAFQPMDLRRAA